jgi:hypothetical protein
MSEVVNKSIPLAQGLGEDPLFQYVRIFTKFLQLAFSSFEKGQFRWCDDLALTDLIIQGEGTVLREVVEKRPAIIVARGPVAFTNIALDQFAGPLLDPKTGRLTANQDLETGARRHTDLLASSVSFNCLSSVGVEAGRIAWVCAYATRTLKRALMRAGMHRVGEDIQVGAESAPGAIVQPDQGEIIMVTVSVPFFFQQTWTTTPLDKTLLNQVTLALRSEVGYPAQDAAVLAGPGMNGMPLQNVKSVSLNQVVITTGTGGLRAKK